MTALCRLKSFVQTTVVALQMRKVRPEGDVPVWGSPVGDAAQLHEALHTVLLLGVALGVPSLMPPGPGPRRNLASTSRARAHALT